MKLRSVLVSIALLTLAACNDPRSPRGFALPDGDAERGERAFVELQCTACHEVAGVELPAPTAEVVVRLGGQTERVKTYGELVTSIINPSHKLATGYPVEAIVEGGASRMTVYNDVMTVRQLIDLVAFLEAHYELQPYSARDLPLSP